MGRRFKADKTQKSGRQKQRLLPPIWLFLDQKFPGGDPFQGVGTVGELEGKEVVGGVEQNELGQAHLQRVQ